MSLDFYLSYEIDGNYIGVFNANITHNLGKMAANAGIYKALWHPEELGAEHAIDILKSLTNGLEDLKNRPDHFKQFDSPNGWGLYEHFVPFVEECLQACRKYPNATVRTST